MVNWNPSRGSEQAGMRPAVVVQTDAANRNPNYPNVVVAAISTKGRDLPFHVSILPSAEHGLKLRSWCKCEQILTISRERLETKLGRLLEDELEDVEQGLRMDLGL